VQRLVFRVGGIALDVVRREEMVLVIERQRPKAVDRWSLALRKGHGVAVGAIQVLATETMISGWAYALSAESLADLQAVRGVDSSHSHGDLTDPSIRLSR
jgi:hypothetical protein